MTGTAAARERGLASLEVLTAATIVAIVLLSVAAMFLTAYGGIERSGRTTAAVAATRLLIEDLRGAPFDGLVAFDGFDTNDPGTQPDAGPERAIARHWRLALAGDDASWSFSDEERERWSDVGDRGAPMSGTIEVGSPTPSMRLVTVTVRIEGRPRPFRIGTLISRI
jgi:hypothetical protein